MQQLKRLPRLVMIALSMGAAMPAFTTPTDFDFLTLAALENFRADKQWCDAHYPEFQSKNDAIFSRSTFGRTTGEAFIQANATGDMRQQLLSQLPRIRAERQSEYAQMPVKFLQTMCSSFETHIGQENMQSGGKSAIN